MGKNGGNFLVQGVEELTGIRGSRLRVQNPLVECSCILSGFAIILSLRLLFSNMQQAGLGSP